MKGFIFDLKSEGGNCVKTLVKDGKERLLNDFFDSYFYLEETSAETAIKSMPEVKKTEKTELIDGSRKRKLLKVYTKEPNDVIKLREDLKEFSPREADIPYIFRYLIDKNLYPMKEVEFAEKDGRITSLKQTESTEELKLKMCAFDLEVYNKNGMPDAERDPIIMISYADEKESTVFHWTKNKGSERAMILDFLAKIRKENPDVIIGYNSSGFDIPYFKKRCAKLELDFILSRDESPVIIKKGAFSTKADIFGRIHFDAYDGAEFLSNTGSISIPKLDIDSVYKEMFNKDKIEVPGEEIWEYWEKGGESLETLIQYNKEDSVAAYEIGKEIIPLYIELARLVGLPVYEISRMSTSQMVEWLLIREAHSRGILIPKQPSEDEARLRMMNPIKGAFVKSPTSGLHEKIVVCDFRSLYPSLIMAYNIDKTTLECKCNACKKNESPMGHKFCTKDEGLIPHILKDLFTYRQKVKTEMKKHKKGTTEYKVLYARQWALKIILNSAYGYMGYGRAKWYSREAAESVTAWARQYIHETIDKAEGMGLEVIYSDTDSTFLKLNDKTIEDAKEFVKSVNKDLPDKMELEFQGFYPRGIFVTKRDGNEAAKKKYALMREDGTLEVKGFELVRRDWANIAKKAQEEVIKAVLKEGKPEKAVEIVKNIVEDLKAHKVGNEDVKIYTQIKRKIDQYEQQAPHVKAAKRLIASGKRIKVGTILEYVVVEGKGSISDRSVPLELIGKEKYDADYYIENQVLPAVMKILHELGVTEDELKFKSKQEGLGKWF